MQTIIYNCDSCGQEFPPKEFAFVNGQTIKVNEKLEPQLLKFEGHFCGECGKKVMEFIGKLNEQKPTKPD